MKLQIDDNKKQIPLLSFSEQLFEDKQVLSITLLDSLVDFYDLAFLMKPVKKRNIEIVSEDKTLFSSDKYVEIPMIARSATSPEDVLMGIITFEINF